MGRKNNADLEAKTETRMMELSREVNTVRKSMDLFADLKARLNLVNKAIEENVKTSDFDDLEKKLENFVNLDQFNALKGSIQGKADGDEIEKKLETL